MFADFLTKAELKFNKGESNILEKTTAENQRGQIQLQLKQLKQDVGIVKLQFKLLLNTNSDVVPDESEQKQEALLNADASRFKQHPRIKLLEQDQQISRMTTKLQRSKLLPDISVMYNNMTMKGVGADNVLYNYSQRFQSAQVGLGIPLFFGSQKAKINSSRAFELMAAANYQAGLQQMQTDYFQAISRFDAATESLKYYETKGLQNATVIVKTASRQFSNGEINYLEWVILMNQAITIQNEHINALKAFNESAIQLNYLNTK
jgi:cobalt-zinc-cadmium resistance protein CzcA